MKIFSVYFNGMGYSIYKPYHETDDMREAEELCRTLSNTYNCKVYVFDNIRCFDYYCTAPIAKEP